MLKEVHDILTKKAGHERTNYKTAFLKMKICITFLDFEKLRRKELKLFKILSLKSDIGLFSVFVLL